MKINIWCASPLDDIRQDGTATLWWMKDGRELNEELECTCIYDMLTAKELFQMVILDEQLSISKDRISAYCIGI